MTEVIDDALAILKAAKANATAAASALDRLITDTLPPDVASTIADVRAKLAGTHASHINLAETLIRIERRLNQTQSYMRFEAPVYWRNLASGGKEGPYCPECWERSQRTTLLHNLPFRGHERWVCRTCQKTFFSAGALDAMTESERSASRTVRGPNDGLHVEE